MNQNQFVRGVVLEETALTVEELARACTVAPEWIVEHVESGLLEADPIDRDGQQTWRFTSSHLIRARRLANFESNFDANPEVAALVVDLLEEIEHLKRRIALAGLQRS